MKRPAASTLTSPSQANKRQERTSEVHQVPTAAASEDAGQAQTRSACRSLLTKAFVAPDIGKGETLVEVTNVSAAVEQALFEKHECQTSKEYKAAGRSLGQNLKRNPDLRQRLLQGELEAGQLVRMQWQELSTTEQRQRDGKVQEKLMRLVTLHDAGARQQEDGDTYACPSCHSTACEVLDAGRRDIGKCETWGSKLSSDHERLVTCLACGHKWEVSGLV